MHYYGKSITEQLEKLFKKWIENQNEEVNNKNENYEGNNYLERYKGGNLRNLDLRNSFTRDGIVNEDAWIKGEKILFILKEANISEQLKDASEGNVIADNGKFWFQETIKLHFLLFKDYLIINNVFLSHKTGKDKKYV